MVELDKIRKLLQSSSLEDIKLGCLFLGEYEYRKIKKFFGDECIDHKCMNVPEYLPEHIICKRPKMSLVIWDASVYLSPTTDYKYYREEPHPDEFF